MNEYYLKSDPACALPVEASLIDRVRKYIINMVNVMYAILVDPRSTYSVQIDWRTLQYVMRRKVRFYFEYLNAIYMTTIKLTCGEIIMDIKYDDEIKFSKANQDKIGQDKQTQ